MKKTAYITLMVLTILLTACDGGDAPIQHADSYDYITFTAQTQKLTTRANPYEAYNPEQHPLTMGTFGYHDIDKYDDLDASTRASHTPDLNPIFSNEVASYSTASKTWTTATTQRWDSYRGAKTFDFFAYMPMTAGAQVGRTATDTYTLSVPFTMPADAHLLFSTKQAPLICALPEHKEGTKAGGNQFTFERTIDMQFDQTLTGFKLLFKIDAKMNAVRHFRLKGVQLKGEIATGGTLSRTYHWANGAWTADKIEWTDLQRTSFGDTGINLPCLSSASTDEEPTMTVSADEYKQWGSEFYMIPDAQLQPIITATYDVEFMAEDGATVVTRKDVTSAITLSKNSFGSIATTKAAMIYPIRILIQPRYLYVLADEDASTGHLLIE